MIKYEYKDNVTSETFSSITSVSKEFLLEEFVPDLIQNNCTLIRWGYVENAIDEPEEYFECVFKYENN